MDEEIEARQTELLELEREHLITKDSETLENIKSIRREINELTW
jgi:hypothetical protein